LAYTSNETGQAQVYVAPFMGSAGKWMISTAGGRAPRWRADGKEIFYLDRDNVVMAADVTSGGAAFEYGPPRALFRSRTSEIAPFYVYDVAPDGQRFLFITPPDEATADQPITVVLNWTEELKQRVPTR